MQLQPPPQQQQQQQLYENLSTSQPSGFQIYNAPTRLTPSSTSLADMSWNSSLFDNLSGQAGGQAGALAGVEGGAQGSQGGAHFGGIMTQLTSASKVLSCHVQPSEDCTLFKPPMGQQQQQH